jgi:hypothetical protein
MPLAPLLAAVVLQSTPLTEDPEVLHDYMAHACRVQQAVNQGGEEAEYTEFCACLSADMAENSSEALFRAMALGSQGTLQDQAMIEDADAAREESERVFGELEPEEQLSAANVIQNGLYACMEFAPVRSE